jgi:hypothetical protein
MTVQGQGYGLRRCEPPFDVRGTLKEPMARANFFMPALPITDDAGSARTLLPAARMPSGTPRLNRVRDRALAVYASAMGLGKRFLLFLCVMLPFFIAIGIASGPLARLGVPRYAVTWSMMLLAMGCSIVFVRWQMWRMRPRAPEIAAIFLEEGICPCCGYNLAGVVAGYRDEAGPNVVCSECGGAWARAKVVRTSEEETHDRREARTLRVILRDGGAAFASMAITDANGASRTMLRTVDLYTRAREATGERRERLRRALAGLRWRGTWLRLLCCTFVLPLVLVASSLVFRKPIESLRWSDAVQLVVVLLWTIGIIAIFRSDLGRTGKKRAATMLGCDLCPCCSSDLPASGSPPGSASDERRVCAECGAAWENSPRTT